VGDRATQAVMDRRYSPCVQLQTPTPGEFLLYQTEDGPTHSDFRTQQANNSFIEAALSHCGGIGVKSDCSRIPALPKLQDLETTY